MSVPPMSSISSSQSTGNAQAQEEQKKNIDAMNFIAMGLRIFKLIKSEAYADDKNTSHTCYGHKGIGNLVIISNKVYILTVAHLFTDQPEEYLLVDGNKPLFPFNHSVKNIAMVDAALILIGDIDPATQMVRIKTNSSFQGTFNQLLACCNGQSLEKTNQCWNSIFPDRTDYTSLQKKLG